MNFKKYSPAIAFAILFSFSLQTALQANPQSSGKQIFERFTHASKQKLNQAATVTSQTLKHTAQQFALSKRDIAQSATIGAALFGASFLTKDPRLQSTLRTMAIVPMLVGIFMPKKLVQKIGKLDVEDKVLCSNVLCKGICSECRITKSYLVSLPIGLLYYGISWLFSKPAGAQAPLEPVVPVVPAEEDVPNEPVIQIIPPIVDQPVEPIQVLPEQNQNNEPELPVEQNNNEEPAPHAQLEQNVPENQYENEINVHEQAREQNHNQHVAQNTDDEEAEEENESVTTENPTEEEPGFFSRTADNAFGWMWNKIQPDFDDSSEEPMQNNNNNNVMQPEPIDAERIAQPVAVPAPQVQAIEIQEIVVNEPELQHAQEVIIHGREVQQEQPPRPIVEEQQTEATDEPQENVEQNDNEQSVDSSDEEKSQGWTAYLASWIW